MNEEEEHTRECGRRDRGQGMGGGQIPLSLTLILVTSQMLRNLHARPIIGTVKLITREEQLGGGTIVVPARAANWSDNACLLPYGELSIREAPPYSPNVDFHAYFAFWKRLVSGNVNLAGSQYMPTGSGSVSSDVEVPDDRISEALTAALRRADGVNRYLVQLTVKHGTVLLEGSQLDTGVLQRRRPLRLSQESRRLSICW